MKVEGNRYLHVGRWIIDKVAGEQDPKETCLDCEVHDVELCVMADICRMLFFHCSNWDVLKTYKISVQNISTKDNIEIGIIEFENNISVCVTMKAVGGKGYELTPEDFESYSV